MGKTTFIMKINIEKNTENIEINDYIIRDLLLDTEDSNIKGIRSKHFQALIAMPNKRFSNLNCILSYYDNENRFLGLDEDSVWLEKEDKRVEIPVSMSLNIPEGAVRSVFNIKASNTGSGFYHWAWRIATITLILILVVWLIRSIQNIL